MARAWPSAALLCAVVICAWLLDACAAQKLPAASSSGGWKPRSDFFNPNTDGSYQFGYSTGDAGQHYHSASASQDNTVSGVFGQRDPVTGRDQQTQYTAGSRGFRARGPHIARRVDLSQNKIPYNPPVSPDSPAYNPTYDTYHDPNEDPTYEFGFKSAVHNRDEQSDARGHVNGRYSFVDDVGLRHVVEYEAGSRTGYHVKTPFPDSNSIGGSLFFHGPPASKTGKATRGHTAIQRLKSGAYRFTAVGPDQRREEQSDAVGNVKGSFTYLDDKGVQRTTQYIAGPNIGYKVIKSQLNTDGGPSAFPSVASPSQSSPFEDKGTLSSDDDDVFDLPEGLKTAATASAVTSSLDPFLGAGSGGHDADIFGGGSHNRPGAGSTKDDGQQANSVVPFPDGSTDDDIFDVKDRVTGAGGGAPPTSAAPAAPPTTPTTGIPYSNCCDLVRRGSVRYGGLAGRATRRRPSPRRDQEGAFTGFPAGVSVRARVQSLDVSPHQPPPGEALEDRRQPAS